jgi:hypothetical protein
MPRISARGRVGLWRLRRWLGSLGLDAVHHVIRRFAFARARALPEAKLGLALQQPVVDGLELVNGEVVVVIDSAHSVFVNCLTKHPGRVAV